MNPKEVVSIILGFIILVFLIFGGMGWLLNYLS